MPIRQFAKISGICAALFLCSSAFAEVESGIPGDSLGIDDSLGIQNSEPIQDLDAQSTGDMKQLSELLRHKVETAQSMQAGDEEISEPIRDEF